MNEYVQINIIETLSKEVTFWRFVSFEMCSFPAITRRHKINKDFDVNTNDVMTGLNHEQDLGYWRSHLTHTSNYLAQDNKRGI